MADVELRQIRKSYDGKQQVVDGIDLAINDGEFVVLVGPSGCGKSTLLRMVAGLESITSGDVLIGGQRVNDEPPRRRDIAMVFQDYALDPHKNLFDNMAFGLRLRGEAEPEVQRRVNDAAKLLQIEHLLQRKPSALSGGQRQRVAIGRAIVRQPKVFLFDEPLSNLDAQLRGEMRAEIKKLHQRLGATMIYVTHDQVEAMTLADRIAVLNGGHTMQYATPDDIYNQPVNLFVAGFMGSPPMNFLDCVLQNNELTTPDAAQPMGLPASVLAALKQQTAVGQIKLGVRPEKLFLADATGDGCAFTGEVVLVEPLGAETLITVRVGRNEMIARVGATVREPMGATVTLFAQARDLNFFDLPSGKALVRVAA